MSAIYCDGFDDYNSLAECWNIVEGAFITTTAAEVRTGTGAFRANGGSRARIQCASTLEHATFIVGVAFYRSSGFTIPEITFLSDAMNTYHVTVEVYQDGAIYALRGDNSGAIIGNTATGLVGAGSWHYMEAKVTLSDTVGAIVVKLDGVQVLNLTNVDTKNGGTKTVFDGIQLRVDNDPAYMDDLYWLNAAGSANNDFLGDRKVVTLYPSGAGTTQQWSVTGSATHHGAVDETPPNTTDYVSSATNAQIELFAMQDLPAGSAAVAFVQAMLHAQKSDAGSWFIKRAMRQSTTNYFGPSISLGTGWDYQKESGKFMVFDAPPAGGSWDVATVNAIELGAQSSST